MVNTQEAVFTVSYYGSIDVVIIIIIREKIVDIC